MRIIEDYYFQKNEDWFDFDEDKEILILTDKAPKNDPKIKSSYKQYLKNRNRTYDCLFADTQDTDIENDNEVEKMINNALDKHNK